MSLFKKLFRQKSEPPSDIALRQQFDAEWDQALTRYRVVTGMDSFSLELKHPQTHQIMRPHEGLGGTFSEWREIRAPYDRRRLIFDMLYSMTGKSLKVWQTANYLVAVRQPDEALALLEEAEALEPPQSDYAPHCAAFAKAALNLTRYSDALTWARKAAEASPDDTHFQTILADALHFTIRESEEAHEIYSRLMAMAPASGKEASDAVKEMFQNLFARETGVVSSPILALELGEHLSDPAQSEEFWDLGETEFYDSPYFRMHHAYHLAKVGKMDRSFVKLIALVQEMPWVKEASLNLLRYFEQFDPSRKEIMPEFQAQLRATVQQNEWTADGMYSFELGQ